MKKFYKDNKTAITLTLFMFIFMVVLSTFCYLSALMEDYKWLQIIFALLVPVILIMVFIFFGRKGAYTDMKILKKNELREESGETLKLKDKLSGYFHYKGYIAGFIITIPLIILLILAYTLPEKAAFDVNIVLVTMYFVFWGILNAIFSSVPLYAILYAIPVIVLSIGLSYNMFGLKLIYQRREIQEERERHQAFSIEARNRMYNKNSVKETKEEEKCE